MISKKEDYFECGYCLNDPESIFSILSEEEKNELVIGHSCLSFKKGEFIYREGDKPPGILFLSKGKVKIFKEGVGGRDQIVRMARPMGFIGYRALFADENYSASATALENCDICVIERNALFTIMRKNSELSFRMMRNMATELGISNNRTVTLTQKHVRGRLAESLIFLIETYGFDKDGKSIKVYLSREDIANLSNMTTSNAIRTLSVFANENVIALEGRKIKILDLPELKRISELG
jgi:CRP-like cAMP-binding protein